jgi:hypothetical protein
VRAERAAIVRRSRTVATGGADRSPPHESQDMVDCLKLLEPGRNDRSLGFTHGEARAPGLVEARCFALNVRDNEWQERFDAYKLFDRQRGLQYWARRSPTRRLPTRAGWCRSGRSDRDDVRTTVAKAREAPNSSCCFRTTALIAIARWPRVEGMTI